MELSAALNRHRLLAAFAALAMWLAGPAWAAFCPCVSVASAANAAPLPGVEEGCTSNCCGPCCPFAPEVQGSKLAPASTARCPVLDAGFFCQAVVPQGSTLEKQTAEDHAIPSFTAQGFSLDLVGHGPPGQAVFCLDRAQGLTLASLVARRCHPYHAPPVS